MRPEPAVPVGHAGRSRLPVSWTRDAWAVRAPTRPALLGMAAVGLGIGLALAGVFHPGTQDAPAVDPGNVAMVNGEPILMNDFVAETEQATALPFARTSDDQRRSVLHGMIDQELMVQRALALDLPEQDTAVRSNLVDAVNNQLAATVLANPPTEAGMRAYFAAHRDAYTTDGSMTLTDLVLPIGGYRNADQSLEQAMADASQAVYELRSGVPVEQVRQHFAMTDAATTHGATLDFAARLHLGARRYTVAQELRDGEVSDPVADTDGVHVLVMHQRVMPVAASFDGVLNNVYSDVIKADEAQARQTELQMLRSTARIDLAPGQAE